MDDLIGTLVSMTQAETVDQMVIVLQVERIRHTLTVNRSRLVVTPRADWVGRTVRVIHMGPIVLDMTLEVMA